MEHDFRAGLKWHVRSAYVEERALAERDAASIERLRAATGEQDPVVPYGASEVLQEQLRRSGIDAELIGFAGGHTIDNSLFPALRQYLKRQWPG